MKLHSVGSLIQALESTGLKQNNPLFFRKVYEPVNKQMVPNQWLKNISSLAQFSQIIWKCDVELVLDSKQRKAFVVESSDVISIALVEKF